MTRREAKVVLLTALAHGQAHLFILTFSGVTIPIAAEFSLNDAGIGRLGSVAALFFGIGALPAGLLADRIGTRWVIAAYLLGASAASILISIARTPEQLAFAFGLLGVSASLYHPAGLSLVTRTVRERGRALGYHGMAGSIAIALAPLIAGVATHLGGTWRAAYAVMAIPGLLLIPGILLLREGGDRDSPAGARDGEGATWPIIASIFALLIILGLTYRGVLNFLPKFLEETVKGPVFGLFQGPSTAGRGDVLAAIVLVSGVPGQWLGGLLSHRFRLEPLTLLLLLLTAGAILGMGLVGGIPLLGSSLLFAFFYFTLQPVGNGLVAKYTSPRHRSLAFGIAFTLSFGVGAAGSTLTGEVSERFGGLSAGMFANGLLLLLGGVAAIALLLLSNRRRRLSTPGSVAKP